MPLSMCCAPRVLVHFLGYGEHHAGALRLRLLEQARVYALCHSDPELEAFGHDAAGHCDEVHVLRARTGEPAWVSADGADDSATVVEERVLVLDCEAPAYALLLLAGLVHVGRQILE